MRLRERFDSWVDSASHNRYCSRCHEERMRRERRADYVLTALFVTIALMVWVVFR